MTKAVPLTLLGFRNPNPNLSAHQTTLFNKYQRSMGDEPHFVLTYAAPDLSDQGNMSYHEAVNDDKRS